jgi:hypothetical protein
MVGFEFHSYLTTVDDPSPEIEKTEKALIPGDHSRLYKPPMMPHTHTHAPPHQPSPPPHLSRFSLSFSLPYSPSLFLCVSLKP